MDEQDIIRQVLAGDDACYKHLVERYWPGLVYYCLTITHDADAAEDIAQDAIITAYNKLDSYDPRFRFSTWLYKIAHNLALKSLRRPLDLLFTEDPGLVAYDNETETLEVENREAAIRLAVADLPVNYQAVIFLHYWEKRDYTEIAEIMSVPSSTIVNWLYRARQQLKKEQPQINNS